MRRFLFFLLIGVVFAGCNSNQQNSDDMTQTVTPTDVNKGLIPSQKMYIRQERDEINQYIKQHHYPMETTATGIHYWIYAHGKGDLVKVGQYVQIAYTISLLDGTVCYNSKQNGPREFCVGKDDIESGIHEAIQLMRPGDKALFILPSYLAHGIAGDEDKIPPGAVLIYDITLLKVQNTP